MAGNRCLDGLDGKSVQMYVPLTILPTYTILTAVTINKLAWKNHINEFIAPDSPLLVPPPFLFLVHLHGMTFPFLSDKKPLWTHPYVT